MQPFSFVQAKNASGAIGAVSDAAGASFFAGGTTLLDLMKLDVIAPTRLVDINNLPFSKIEVGSERVTIGANVRNSDLASHPAIRQGFPALSEALLSGASAQLRNMATTAGNLMQRTRCSYFRDLSARCNKRNPGAGCDAISGVNKNHAVLGTSEQCIATHPSDMCVALVILDATVQTQLPDGTTRLIPIGDFHLMPGSTPHMETALEHGELITHIHLPIVSLARRSHYLKVRDRASYEFALASAAVAVTTEGGVIAEARVGLGGIATRPWRSLEAETALIGQPASDATFLAAANAALAGARPQQHNAFKIGLAKETLMIALQQVTKGNN